MNVKELKELLSKYPDSMRVVVRGYEEGYNDIQCLKEWLMAIDICAGTYFGAHDYIRESEISKYNKVEKVLELYGENHLVK
jgi:hypothetical protein